MRYNTRLNQGCIQHRLLPCPSRGQRYRLNLQPEKCKQIGFITISILLISINPLLAQASGQLPPTEYATQTRTPFVIQETYQQSAPNTPAAHGIVGLDMQIHPSQYPLVRAVFQGTPAYQKGIHPGDAIIAVNGTYTRGKSREEVDALISDIPGDSVTFTIQRGSQIHQIPLHVMALEALSATQHPTFSTLFQRSE